MEMLFSPNVEAWMMEFLSESKTAPHTASDIRTAPTGINPPLSAWLEPPCPDPRRNGAPQGKGPYGTSRSEPRRVQIKFRTRGRALAPHACTRGWAVEFHPRIESAPYKEGGKLACRELLFECVNVGKRNRLSIGEHWPEIAAPERIAHQRERATRQPVESAIVVKKANAAGLRASELDGRLDGLAAGTAKEGFAQIPTRAHAVSTGEFTRQFGDVALQHRVTASIDSSLNCGNNLRMIMPSVVDAIAGKEIDDAPATGEQLSARAAIIADVYPQQRQ